MMGAGYRAAGGQVTAQSQRLIASLRPASSTVPGSRTLVWIGPLHRDVDRGLESLLFAFHGLQLTEWRTVSSNQGQTTPL